MISIYFGAKPPFACLCFLAELLGVHGDMVTVSLTVGNEAS